MIQLLIDNQGILAALGYLTVGAFALAIRDHFFTYRDK